MADEFYEKYKHLSHQELYQMLHAGVPRQVDGVGDAWASVASTLGGLADTLRQDMSKLLSGFDGSASQDVLEGLTALAQRAKILAEEAGAMRTGLTAMAQALASAKAQAEAPQAVPAAAAVTQTVSFVLGAEVGHLPTPEEQARARERMVWLVARLAAQYGLAEHTNWPVEAVLPSAIMAGAVTVMHGHGHGDGHHRHGTRLQGAADLTRQHIHAAQLSPLLSSQGVLQPHSLGATSAEAAGALRAGGPMQRPPSVHIVGGTPAAAAPLASVDGGPASTAAATGQAAPPPPVGLGAGGMTPAAGGVIGGSGAPAGGLGAGGALGPGGMADVTWQTADNVEWMDPDDAAPPVIGG